MNCLFLEFSIQYFHPRVDCGTEIAESETMYKGGTAIIHLQPLRQPLGREVGLYTRHLGSYPPTTSCLPIFKNVHSVRSVR